MPGVFRDPAGEYRYYTVNEYEERRRADWDRLYGADRFKNPRHGPPAPTFALMKFAPMPAPQAPVAPQVVISAPETMEWRPIGGGIVDQLNQVPDDALNFEQLVERLPAQHGENAAFDALFDRLTADNTTVDYKAALDLLLGP